MTTKRKQDKKSWATIASEVKNMKGRRPYWKVVRKAFREMSSTKGRVMKDNYHKCGRKKTLTKELTDWLIKKMLKLRLKT